MEADDQGHQAARGVVLPMRLRSLQGGSGGRPKAPSNGHRSWTQLTGLATHLVGRLVEDGVVVIDVHNLQVDGDLGCPRRGPIVRGPHGKVEPVHFLIVHCPVGNDLP